MDKGIYCLTFRASSGEVRVGAIGPQVFGDVWLVYAGSAQGSGGLSRVRRHILFPRSGKRPRWHVDYLLSSPLTALVAATCAYTNEPLECRLAGLLAGMPGAVAVPRFGCSDCRCPTHLWAFPADPENGILACFKALGLSNRITRIITIHVQD